MNDARQPRRRALISVSDKKGLVPLAEELRALRFELVSTGGTASLLLEAGLPVTAISDVTGFPEIMGGRVKTLHPAVHGGLLARRGLDEAAAAEHGIGLIDLLVVNLYPFEEAIARPDCSFSDAIENIDIGGPAMLRAAAKNHARVTVVVDPTDYEPVLDAFRAGEPSEAFKLALASKAFSMTAAYDAAIGRYLDSLGKAESRFPPRLTLSYRKSATLRYGENPHQRAAVYVSPSAASGSIVRSAQLQGKTLSFNNLLDADTALQCAKSWTRPACAIVKHASPCGIALGIGPAAAYAKAYASDPASAFGGVIAFNTDIDAATARAIIANQFAEVVVGSGVEELARDVFGKKPNIRVLEYGAASSGTAGPDLRSLEGGLLVQDRDAGTLDETELDVVTKRQPTEQELRDLRFAWTAVRFVKSNAIVFAADCQTLGIGGGQTSRVMSAKIAALKAEEQGFSLNAAVMASDAFFPFRDGIDAAAEHGIRAVIQPGGSIKDAEVIAAADEHGIAMIFTGQRHFRH